MAMGHLTVSTNHYVVKVSSSLQAAGDALQLQLAAGGARHPRYRGRGHRHLVHFTTILSRA